MTSKGVLVPFERGALRRFAATSLLAFGSFAALATGCDRTSSCREASEFADVSAPRYAVLASDYASSAVVLVADDGTVIAPWLDSGSRPPNLVAAVSGDVVIPRAQPRVEGLTLIDRYQTDVLTFIPFRRPLEGLWQADLRGGRTSGSSPNPHDLVAWSDSLWLVSRFNPAEDPEAPDLARGNDLAFVDPSRRAIVGRLDLGADVIDAGVRYFARPSKLGVLRNGANRRLVVGLARLASLALRRTGPGAVTLVDPDARASHVLELAGLSNCGAVATLPDEPDRALVLCRGDAFSERPIRAGLVEVQLAGERLREVARFEPEEPLAPSNGLVSLGSRLAVYVASGSLLRSEPDRLVLLDLNSGALRVVAESGPLAFEFGEGAVDDERAELLVPDGNSRSVRRFSLRDGLVELEPLEVAAGCVTMPPREVVVLRP